jgi:hypothetical protein
MGSDSQAEGNTNLWRTSHTRIRLTETACVPSSQRSNYSLSIREKNPNFSASNPVNLLEARFWIASALPTI